MKFAAYPCPNGCGRTFNSPHAAEMHAGMSVRCTRPNRYLLAKDRPTDRGSIVCGHCEATFRNERDAAQHRRDKHGIKPPPGSDHGERTGAA